MKEDHLVGGVRRLQADRDFEMREMLAAEYPEGLINNILSQEQRLTELKKSDNGTPAFSIETTNAQAQQIYHMFVIVNHGTIFDFWMRTDVFSEADIRVFQKSLVIGSERADQPNSSMFFTAYQPGMIRDGIYQPNIGASYWYLWEDTPEGVALLDTGTTVLAGLPSAKLHSPLWSPDGSHLVVILETQDFTSFYFPLEALQYEVPFPKNRDHLLALFSRSGWDFDYRLADQPQATLFPLDWSLDGSKLLFYYEWFDSEHIARSGKAWYILGAESNQLLAPAD